MANLVERTLYRLGERLPGRVDAERGRLRRRDGHLVKTGRTRAARPRPLPAKQRRGAGGSRAICPFSQYLPDPAGIPDALPKNRAGKLHRRALRESLAGVEASQGSGPGIRRG